MPTCVTLGRLASARTWVGADRPSCQLRNVQIIASLVASQLFPLYLHVQKATRSHAFFPLSESGPAAYMRTPGGCWTGFLRGKTRKERRRSPHVCFALQLFCSRKNGMFWLNRASEEVCNASLLSPEGNAAAGAMTMRRGLKETSVLHCGSCFSEILLDSYSRRLRLFDTP